MQVVDATKQENTTTEIDEVQIYDDEIKLQLDNFCDDFQIEDMSKESQNKWNAALLYIYKYVFKDTNKLKDKTNISNRYNIDMVKCICDIYINLCYLYDKEISIMGFSKLTGIDTDTIYSWSNNEYMASFSASDVFKKLNKEREESLSNILISGKRNPVGILGALNRHYQWNMPGVSNKDNAKALNKQTPEQIAKQYNNTIDVTTAAELPPV